jgi:hypothetical protein
VGQGALFIAGRTLGEIMARSKNFERVAISTLKLATTIWLRNTAGSHVNVDKRRVLSHL